MDDKKILLNLEDPSLEKIAEILKNKTAKRILIYLGEEIASVSKVAKNLKIPINTVDYNIKNLKKVGLIEEKKHFWSDRGKRMPAYGVVNREIVISPRKSFFRNGVLTAGFISLIGGLFINLSNKPTYDYVEKIPTLTMDAGTSAVREIASTTNPGIPWLSWIFYILGVCLILYWVLTKLRRLK